MDWSFIIPHLISGSIPVMAGLAIYDFILRSIGKRQAPAHIILSFVFCFYLVGILTMTGVCFQGSFSPRTALIPFADMLRGPVDTILNILLLMPMGVFLPLLYEKFDKLIKAAAAGFLVSLSVELAQMFCSGNTDINDLITNTTGACLGYGLYKMLYKAIPKSLTKQIRAEGVQCCYEPLIFWAGSLLMMITVQIWIFRAFFRRV